MNVALISCLLLGSSFTLCYLLGRSSGLYFSRGEDAQWWHYALLLLMPSPGVLSIALILNALSGYGTPSPSAMLQALGILVACGAISLWIFGTTFRKYSDVQSSD